MGQNNRWGSSSSKGTATTAPSGQGSSAPEGSREAIAKRAYQKFLARGCKHGHDQQDWLEAEREIKSEALRRRNS